MLINEQEVEVTSQETLLDPAQVASKEVKNMPKIESRRSLEHKALANHQKKQVVSFEKAIKILREERAVRFIQSVDVCINLKTSVVKPGSIFRGSVFLPKSTGRVIRVAAFAQGKDVAFAKEAGAEFVGAEDLVERIQKNEIKFDRCVASPLLMAMVGRVAKILGPRGILPNPKDQTVAVDIAQAIKRIKQGQIVYKTDKVGRVLHGKIGSLGLLDEDLKINFRAFLKSVLDQVPSGIDSVYINTTMGSGIKIDFMSEWAFLRSETSGVAS